MAIENTVAVVTGGARGIGAAIVRALAETGSCVYALDIAEPEEELDATLAGRVRFSRTDISSEREVGETFSSILKEAGRVDTLVNNAGIIGFWAVDEMTVADWERILSTNLTAAMLCTREVVAPMKKQGGGSIINISSIHATLTAPNVSAYATSKGAMVTMTRSNALELGPSGIRVNAVMPGYTMTPLFMNDATRDPQGEQSFIERVERRVALRRIGETWEVAALVAYLASDRASYITGAAIAVDGGASVNLESGF